MKKLILGLVIGILIGASGTVLAATDSVQAVFSKFNLKVNEKKPIEIQPLTHDGKTYLPVREVADFLGFDVDYVVEDKTIVLNSKSLVINENEVINESVIMNENVLMDKNDEWIPLRELGEKYNVTITSAFTISLGESSFTIDYQSITDKPHSFETPYGSIEVYRNTDGLTYVNLNDWHKVYSKMQNP